MSELASRLSSLERQTGRLSQAILRLPVWAMVDFLIHHQIVTLQHLEYLQQASEFLRQKQGSLLLYFIPHFSLVDPALITKYVINDLLRTDQTQVAWLASAKLNPQLAAELGLPNLGLATIISEESARRMNIIELPIVQSYMISKLRKTDKYKAHRAVQIDRESRDKAIKLLNEPGNTLAASWEGGRSTDGTVHRFQQEAEKFLETPHVLAMPIVVRGSQRILPPTSHDLFRVRTRQPVTLAAGPLIDINGAKEIAQAHRWVDGNPFTVADALALHALQHLSLEAIDPHVDPYGVYAQKNIVEVTSS